MGIYLNPGNDLFAQALNSEIYIDKSMLIKLTNERINSNDRHLCVSRPRRFGKSMAANMLVAYYSRNCDSKELFSSLAIADSPDFERHLNKYNVIHLDMTRFASKAPDVKGMIDRLEITLKQELSELCSDISYPDFYSSDEMLTLIYNKYRIPFVFIIDEWDCVFRIHKKDTEGQTAYLDYLKILLKDRPYVALDYATGILPVKKYGQHSALNMYCEFSIIEAEPFAEYTGFTEAEVQNLCQRFDMSFDELKNWYNGYQVGGISIYNPQSVVNACTRKRLSNYWTKT